MANESTDSVFVSKVETKNDNKSLYVIRSVSELNSFIEKNVE